MRHHLCDIHRTMEKRRLIRPSENMLIGYMKKIKKIANIAIISKAKPIKIFQKTDYSECLCFYKGISGFVGEFKVFTRVYKRFGSFTFSIT